MLASPEIDLVSSGLMGDVVLSERGLEGIKTPDKTSHRGIGLDVKGLYGIF
jgi:hypothetical protein